MSPASALHALLAAAALLAAQAATSAQLATQIAVAHHHGQTFVTWKEAAQAGVRYRVYRSASALQDAGDLAAADFLGEVDDRSSRNQGRSLATASEHGWIIVDGGAELPPWKGLFVYTASVTQLGFYAVTSVQAGVENLVVTPGTNATRNGISEGRVRPRPVLQSADALGSLYAHWVQDRDTPFQPALSQRASHGFNFRFEPGSAPGPHGLVLRLHAAGQTYAQGWPQRFETPPDVDILAPSDLYPHTSWTFWFGAHEELPGAPQGSTRVWNFTQQRLFWTLDWITGELGLAHDRERVYVVGGSMGAIGGLWLLDEQPGRFAAALLRNGLFDLEATDYRNPGIFRTLFGAPELDLPTRTGLSIWDRTDGTFMAARDPASDWPVIRTINGRMDETVGWSSAVSLYTALAEARRPAVHYFDEREHTPHGAWEPLERALLARTYAVRRDRPSLRFGACTLDDDAGDGQRLEGDLVGTINGYVDYDPELASATGDAVELDVFVRANGVLDDAPAASALATLTPRRTGPFALGPGSLVHFTLREGVVLKAERWLRADEHGLVTTPLVPLSTLRRTARFEHYVRPLAPALLVGGAPRAGDDVQIVAWGEPGTTWAVVVAAGDASGPTGAIGSLVEQGRFGAYGGRELRVPIPESVPGGTRIWARMLHGERWLPWTSVEVQ
jgi:hypothetical protein